MAVIPNGQKFQTLSSDVDTTERRSALINDKQATYTMADIIETVGGGGGSSYLVYTGYFTQSGTNAPVITTLENTTGGGTILTTRFVAGFYEFSLNPPAGVEGTPHLIMTNSVSAAPNNRTLVSEVTTIGSACNGFQVVSYGNDPAVSEDLNGEKIYFELRLYS